MNQVRIIAGQWRGRRLSFPDQKGLRPTGDRVRETLFNWLQPWMNGAACLDLFAGSGAIGFEAASRGASTVTLLEKAKIPYRQLLDNKKLLTANDMSIHQMDALQWLRNESTQYDVIFMDPPFEHWELAYQAIEVIAQQRLLKASGFIYLEYPYQQEPELMQGWEWHRKKKVGDVGFGLIKLQHQAI